MLKGIEELNKLSNIIIKSAYKVHNSLGSGFLEKVYLNALQYELSKLNLKVEIQKPLKVYYEDIIVGEFFADLVVEDDFIVELKAVNCIEDIHKLQLLNYLKATHLKIGLLINFGDVKLQLKRVVNNL
jgi:GxxExxY protein